MKNLILHIGLHKTGSSSIQKWLSDNRAILRLSDATYPLADGLYNHHDIVARIKYAKEFGFLEEYLTRFDTSNAQNIILSSEEFSSMFLDDQDTKRFFGLYSIRYTIKIVVFLRRQDFLLESAFKEDAKALRARNFFEFDYYEVDHRRRIEIILQCVPDSHITLLPYRPGKAVSQFAKALGLHFDENKGCREPRENPSIHRRLALALGRLARPGIFSAPQFVDFLVAAGHIHDDHCRYIMSPKQRRTLVNKYSGSNRDLLQKFNLDPSTFFDEESVDDVWFPPEPISHQELAALYNDILNRSFSKNEIDR